MQVTVFKNLTNIVIVMTSVCCVMTLNISCCCRLLGAGDRVQELDEHRHRHWGLVVLPPISVVPGDLEHGGHGIRRSRCSFPRPALQVMSFSSDKSTASGQAKALEAVERGPFKEQLNRRAKSFNNKWK